MKRAILVLLSVCLLASVVFGTVKLFEHYGGEGASDYEKLEADRAQEQAEGKDTFPLTTLASRTRFVALYCLYMARSEDQLRRCNRRPARDVYRSSGNEYAWLFASEAIDYCYPGGSAGPFCDPADVNGPVDRIRKLTGS